MKTIAIASQKGGVGKTSTAAALAHGLSLRGHKVLCIDLDPQRNLSQVFRADDLDAASLTDIMLNPDAAPGLTAAISPVPEDAAGSGVLDIVPASEDLSRVEQNLQGEGRAEVLRSLLLGVSESYDYCVIDTAPGLGLLSVNALTAADGVVIPSRADSLSLYGVMQVLGTVEALKKLSNPSLKVLGFVITCFDGRTTLAKTVEQTLRNFAEEKGVQLYSPIKQAIAVQEAQAQKQSLLRYAPRSPAAAAYREIVEAVENQLS